MTATQNPFETPHAELGAAAPPGSSASSEDEAVRRALLTHEVSIRAVGRLMILGGVLSALAGLSMLVVILVAGPSKASGMAAVMALYGALGAFAVWVGNQLRRLDPRGRIPGAIIHAVGLLGFPVGTVISAYVLHLLLSNNGRRVLSIEYQGVVARTPHIRYKTPILLIVLVALLVAGSVGALFATRL